MGASVLFKYMDHRDRVPKFLKKYKKGLPFVLTDGHSVVLAYEKGKAQLLELRDVADANNLRFVSKKTPSQPNPRVFRLSDFAKTPEFGGKFGVRGDTETASVVETLQYEVAVVNTINDFIKKKKGVINIHLEGLGTYGDITGVVGAKQVDSGIKSSASVKSDPKADIIVYQKTQDYLNNKNIFISHKKAGGPEAFQQYGGITERAGTNIYNHPEVQEFLSEIISYIGEEGLVNPIMKPVHDVLLKNLSIFGPNFQSGRKLFGLQNVNLIGQGLPTFHEMRDMKNTYIMRFTPMSLNGDLTHFTAGYEPVFGATFREGRGFTYKGVPYTGCRVGIYPKALIMNRKRLVTL